MHLISIVVENVKSFRERVETNFDRNLNILIGPNGGGKSNLIDIITISMNKCISPFFTETKSGSGVRIESAEQSNSISIGSLDPHFSRQKEDTCVELTFCLSEDDLADIERTKEHITELRTAESSFYYNSRRLQTFNLQKFDKSEIPKSREITFEITNSNLKPQSAESLQAVQKYMGALNYIDIVSNHIDSFSITPPFIHFSAYRGGTHEGYRIETPNESQGELITEYMSSTSGEQSSAVDFSLYNLASKFLDYKHKSIEDGFDNDREVTTIRSYFDDIGSVPRKAG